MRFEARHNYFKKLARTLGNFKNLCSTLANRYQQLQCYLSINKSVFYGPDLEVGPSESLDASSVPTTQFNPNGHPHFLNRCIALKFTLIQIYISIQTCSLKWAKVDGTLYRRPCFLNIGIINDVFPVFGKLEKILMTDTEEIYFEVESWVTVRYDSHYNAYVISSTEPLQCLTLHHEELISHIPLHARNVIGLTGIYGSITYQHCNLIVLVTDFQFYSVVIYLILVFQLVFCDIQKKSITILKA